MDRRERIVRRVAREGVATHPLDDLPPRCKSEDRARRVVFGEAEPFLYGIEVEWPVLPKERQHSSLRVERRRGLHMEPRTRVGTPTIAHEVH